MTTKDDKLNNIKNNGILIVLPEESMHFAISCTYKKDTLQIGGMNALELYKALNNVH